jgi:hypothetical protein
MKPARELLKGGRVSEAKYEPPLLTSLRRGYGVAGAAGGGFAPACEFKSALDVENRNRIATRSSGDRCVRLTAPA